MNNTIIYYILYIFVCIFSSKTKRREFRLKQKMILPDSYSKRINYQNENKICIIFEDGTQIINPKYIKGLRIKFNGNNNLITLYAPINFVSSDISLYEDCNVVIKPSKHISINCNAYKKSKLIIEENVWIGSAFIQMMNKQDTSLEIKKNSALSTNVNIWTTDTHNIYDKNSGELTNNLSSKVILGEHCWIGANATLLKNARIPDGAIVGFGSVVTSKFDTPNTVIAGNPAKIVKENVSWEGGNID